MPTRTRCLIAGLLLFVWGFPLTRQLDAGLRYRPSTYGWAMFSRVPVRYRLHLDPGDADPRAAARVATRMTGLPFRATDAGVRTPVRTEHYQSAEQVAARWQRAERALRQRLSPTARLTVAPVR